MAAGFCFTKESNLFAVEALKLRRGVARLWQSKHFSAGFFAFRVFKCRGLEGITGKSFNLLPWMIPGS